MKFIFGASGHAKEIEWLIHDIYTAQLADHRPDYFVCEDGNPLEQSKINHVQIINESKFLDLTQNNLPSHECFIAVGDPTIREKIVKKILNHRSNMSFPNLIHPSICMDQRLNHNLIGMGNIIFAGSTITTHTKLADFIHINLHCTISHDVKIQAYCTLSPGVHICGNVTLEEKVFLGAGATVIDGITIKKNITIGAGAVVVKDLLDPHTYTGVPAKQLIKNKQI